MIIIFCQKLPQDLNIQSALEIISPDMEVICEENR